MSCPKAQDDAALLFALVLQGREPKFVRSVHERVRMRRVRRIGVSDAGFLGNDPTSAPHRMEAPGVVVDRIGVAHGGGIPADLGLRNVGVELCGDGRIKDPEGHQAVFLERPSILHMDILHEDEPGGPFLHVREGLPDAVATHRDDELIVREVGGNVRVVFSRPGDGVIPLGEIGASMGATSRGKNREDE